MSTQLVAPRFAKRSTAVLACAIVMAGGHGAHASTEPPAASPDDVISIVAVGDSIPFNSPQDCPGCTGFVDAYGESVAAATGTTVEVTNRSRHDSANTAMILEQLESGDLDELLAGADIVILSTGFNDQPPYFTAHYGDRPCADDAQQWPDQYLAVVLDTTTTCIDENTTALRTYVADVLTYLRGHAPNAAIGALTAYNVFIDDPDTHATLSRSDADRVVTTIDYALDQWRTALCAETALVDAVCVDIFEAFNGSDGLEPAGDLLAADHTHPSQAGNDRIRDALVASSLQELDA